MALTQALTIGIDIGGTKVAAGVVDPEGNILDRLRRDTPTKDPRETEDAIADIVRDLESRHDVIAVGIGAAGFVDGTRSSVLFAPHLAWRHEPLRDAVERRLGLPVVVENDANAAAWSEWRFGGGQGESHLVCVTLGTGIGGAILNDGALQRGKFGIAGEFGHMQVVPGGHRCECGNRGCWEQYASGNALTREARELALSGSPVAHDLLRAAEGDPRKINGPMVTELAKDGDPVAVELLEDVGRWLGIGLANLAAALDPGTFVIGGGVSRRGRAPAGAGARGVQADADRARVPAGGADRARRTRSGGRDGRRGRPGSRRGDLAAPGPGEDDRGDGEDGCCPGWTVDPSRAGCPQVGEPPYRHATPPSRTCSRASCTGQTPNCRATPRHDPVHRCSAAARAAAQCSGSDGCWPARLRVLSYNVHRWGDDREALARVVQACAPDVDAGAGGADLVGDAAEARAMAATFGMRYVAASARNAILVAEGTEVVESLHWRVWRPFVRRRFRLIATQLPGGAVGGRITLGAQALALVVCHLGLHIRGREHEIEQVLKGCRAFDLPYLLVGDLNEEPDGPVWKRLADEGLTDLGIDAGPTFHSDNPEQPHRRRPPLTRAPGRLIALDTVEGVSRDDLAEGLRPPPTPDRADRITGGCRARTDGRMGA